METVDTSKDGNEVDEESKKHRFGWSDIDGIHIPYIFRTERRIKYMPIRMLEGHLLKKFLNALPNEVTTLHRGLHCMTSVSITKTESQLLNEINLQHSDSYFGKELFSCKDKIVPLQDAKEFYEFLKFCYQRLVSKEFVSEDVNSRGGFMKINGESEIPYILLSASKFMPLFYFEEIAEHITYKTHRIDGWNLAYLKFCCKIQGIKKELFASDACDVISFDEVSKNFPPDTAFKQFWPTKQKTILSLSNQSTLKNSSAETASKDKTSSFESSKTMGAGTGATKNAKQTPQRNHLTRQTRRDREEPVYYTMKRKRTHSQEGEDNVTKSNKIG